ncbi:transglutaminase-like domain-containing protein [Fimbriimonas ginsengisoli]|uniref:Transglutaminase domain protein n=1 Tax=Fimbriimonas ginsengisoli Gsoil 348 TaxID=661478 RepID=A0A068NRC9_FIMGI|nr:transglutaminase family protein [Fimbriimonas ginsengisoli]AIE84149.1 transglutaminase domain protein [Fimbriimonas ginsengisoli Gsoil 348]
MLLHDPLPKYLESTAEVDYDHPSVQAFVRDSGWLEIGTVDRAEKAFRFVRDEVPHSWDIQSPTVTCSASETLAHRTGICYAKSHLLAALLRATGIPAGFCYQRLVLFEDPADGYSIHALNAFYVESLDKWVRMDARGNKPGVDAQFSLEEERLAFSIRPEMGEMDYPGVYAVPSAKVVQTLRVAQDARAMYAHDLPSEL